MKRYLGLSRWWYNKSIEYLRQPGTKASLIEVRKIQHTLPQTELWALDCPQRIREHAINEACLAVKNAKAKFKKTKLLQKVSFRRRHDPAQRFGFDSISLHENFVFAKKSFKAHFHLTEATPDTALEGTKIVCEDKRWFLIVPANIPQLKPETQRLRVVALDPGVRSFISYYSPQCHGKIGDQDFQRLARLCWQMDKLISRASKAAAKTRAKMRLALQRMRWRIYDLVDDIHKKTANFLVTRFDCVVIPPFESSKMVSRLRSKTARSMLTWAHYRFRQFLLAKAEQYSCEVIIQDEAYTSKTCSYCGKMHRIGASREMKCCGTVDRDYNGARGILLRALSAPTFGSDRINAVVNES